MLSIKNYYIFGILLFFYICIQSAAWGEINDKTEYYIKMPNVLSKILFPFKKNTRVRITFCVLSGYIEISSIVICVLTLLKKGDLNEEDITTTWFIFFWTVTLIVGTIEGFMNTIYEGKDRNLLYRLLSWVGCTIASIITMGWLAFAIYYLVFFKCLY